MIIIRQSTSVTVSFGPFVLNTDGVTLVTNLVGTGANQTENTSTGIRIAKNGGAFAARHATASASVYDAYGNYLVILDTTDTNTLGVLRMQFVNSAAFCPVFMDMMVVTANTWDSFFATTLLQVDLTQVKTGAVPTPGVTGVPLVDAKYLLGTVFATPAVAGIIDVNVKNINNVAATSVTTVAAVQGTTIAPTFTGSLIKSDVTDWNGSAVVAPITAGVPVVDWTPSPAELTGTATASAAATITLAAAASATANFYCGMTILITSGTGKGQARLITGYTTGRVATVTPAWTTTPASTATYIIFPHGPADIEVLLAGNNSSGAAVTNATAGILDVNAKNINNVSTSSVTAINANQGTTQPVNFTGTGASALAKSDTVDIAGAAVSATTAQIGANVVNWNNTVVATPATAGIPDVNTKNVNNVSASSVTTVAAVQGTTVAPTFTGSLIKSDVTDWNATAVATPATAGIPEVNVKNINNVSTAPVTTVKAVQGLTTADTITTVTTTTNLTNAPTAGDFTAAMKTSLNAATPVSTLTAAESGIVQSGTAAAGAATTITIATALGADNICNGQLIKITSGTGVGQSRIITGYVNSTKVVTVDYAWTTNPDNTSVYAIMHANQTALSSTALKVTDVALVDTLTTYTGNTPQTGDSFTRIGATGSGLTSLPTAAQATDIQNRLPAALTGAGNIKADAQVVSDKTGYALTSAYDPSKTASQAGDAMTLTAGERTATADALLNRDIAGGTSGGIRNVRNCLRTLRNKQAITAGVYTCYAEDDATPVFEANVVTTAGNPMSSWSPTA